jgi:uncharacterized protein DUF6893
MRLSRVIEVAIVAGVLVAVIRSVPDIKRYMKIRRM